MDFHIQNITQTLNNYNKNLKECSSSFEYSPDEDLNKCILNAEQFIDQNLSIYDEGINTIEELEKMTEIVEEQTYKSLKRTFEAITIVINNLTMITSKGMINENEYADKMSEWQNRKKDIKMKMQKLMKRKTQQCLRLNIGQGR